MEKNLESKDAFDKFKMLVEEIRICMFITETTNEREHTRPMATIEVEEDGTLWFFTDIRSIKVEEVAKDKMVHLVYAHPGKSSYLDVWGSAAVIADKQTLKDKWSPVVKAYFPDGVSDPNISLLKVKPLNVYYWQAESGKMVHFLKQATSIVTGKKIAEGAEGRLAL